jgi:hypothetical protein
MALLNRIHRSRRFALFALTQEALKVIVCFFELRAQSPFGFSPPNYPAASSLQTKLELPSRRDELPSTALNLRAIAIEIGSTD